MAWPDQVLNFLSKVRHRATLPTAVADGAVAELVGDRFGRLVTVGPQPSGHYVAPTLTDHGRIVAQAGQLLELCAANGGAEARWLMLFDSSAIAAPSNGSTPVERFLVPAGGTCGFAPSYPLAFMAGIHWAVSSTGSTLTLDTTATFHLSATCGT